MYIYMYAHTHTHTYTCMYMCMYVCVCVCVCVCIKTGASITQKEEAPLATGEKRETFFGGREASGAIPDLLCPHERLF